MYVFLLLFFISQQLTTQVLAQAQHQEQPQPQSPEPPVIIDANQSIECDQKKKICTATGDATALKEGTTLYGDVLKAYFEEENGKREITHIDSEGHTRLVDLGRTAEGESGRYTIADEHVVLKGANLKLTTPKEVMVAKEQIDYYRLEKKAIAHKDAVVYKGDNTFSGDKVFLYFKDAGPLPAPGAKNDDAEVDWIEAMGHVMLTTPDDIVQGDFGYYKIEEEKIYLVGNVKLTNPGNQADGLWGIYDMKAETTELFSTAPTLPFLVKHYVAPQKIGRVHGYLTPKKKKSQKISSPTKNTVKE